MQRQSIWGIGNNAALLVRAVRAQVARLGILAAACGDTQPIAHTPSTSGNGGAGQAGGLPSGGGAFGSGGSVGGISDAGGAPGLPYSFVVSGVVTDGSSPLSNAIVMQGGTDVMFRTGADGAFSLELTKAIVGTPTLVAAKEGYRSSGIEFLDLEDIASPVTLPLLRAAPPDNDESYFFKEPGSGDPSHDNSTAYCGHCHTTFTAEFQSSAHARAARDPIVQDLYAGTASGFLTEALCLANGGTFRTGRIPGTTTATERCYLGNGVLPDLNSQCGAPGDKTCDDPNLELEKKATSYGECANCHAAGIDGPAGGRDLLDAQGTSYENGNHCDVCHKVSDIDLKKPPGSAGALIFQRPREHLSSEIGSELAPVMFGPLPDVPNPFMGGSYQPKFSTSEFCGACHEHTTAGYIPESPLDPSKWPNGLPTYSTYSEWFEGPFNSESAQCQACHMPESEGLKSTVDVTDETNADLTNGFVRPPSDIKSHVFRGPLSGDPRLIDGALDISISSTVGASVSVDIALANVGCGHAIPTGQPMRALLLVVDASACGKRVHPAGGMTLNDVGGAKTKGIVGTDIMEADEFTLSWPAALDAEVGDVIRFARKTGIFDDYVGPGRFADPSLSAADKGMELNAALGETTIVSVDGTMLTVDKAIALNAGDLAYLGSPFGSAVDGAASLALAGAPGYAFARVMVDANGERNVPHYRAVDIASDNRIPPGELALTNHIFERPSDCDELTLGVYVFYRAVPFGLSRERGYTTTDALIASKVETLSLLP